MKPLFETILPADAPIPLIFDSPHSGLTAPDDWKPIAEESALLSSWDAFVDELFGAAPKHGATLLRAFFPRSFIDLNRGRDDIDPELIAGDWDWPLNPTKKSAVGFGLLRRYALPGVPVYGQAIQAETLRRWIETYYDPYHAALAHRIEELHSSFGFVRHIDCHSMKSMGNEMNDDAGLPRPDFVISDRDGTTSHPKFTNWVATLFRERGYSATVNDPYKGAQLVAAYGKPDRNIYSVQIEVNRKLYMNERAFEKGTRFNHVQADISSVIKAIADRIRQDIAA